MRNASKHHEGRTFLINYSSVPLHNNLNSKYVDYQINYVAQNLLKLRFGSYISDMTIAGRVKIALTN